MDTTHELNSKSDIVHPLQIFRSRTAKASTTGRWGQFFNFGLSGGTLSRALCRERGARVQSSMLVEVSVQTFLEQIR